MDAGALGMLLELEHDLTGPELVEAGFGAGEIATPRPQPAEQNAP